MLPLVAKPLLVDGSAKSHELFYCLSFSSLLLAYALLIIGIPDGPTAHFKLSKLVLRKDLKRGFVDANEVKDKWTTYVLDELS
ncbi:hypothetical protein RIF29_25588 [Crotalaria pallida]|uniref:Uncharacterized protein n=1 Tax=Crotalaria pallida TaxID=3830 RepID=A0AAN9EU26_CROPI